MVLCVNKDGYVVWTNPDDSVKESCFKDDSSVLVIKDLELNPPSKAGFDVIMYLNDDLKTVRYEFIERKKVELQEELTPFEIIGQQLSDLEIQQLEYNIQAVQEREFLGQQLSDLEISMLERGL